MKKIYSGIVQYYIDKNSNDKTSPYIYYILLLLQAIDSSTEREIATETSYMYIHM